MIIDCGECAVRGNACADCVVTFLTVPVRPREPAVAAAYGPDKGPDGGPGGTARVELDAAEQGAVGVLADAGLVPPLRLRRVV